MNVIRRIASAFLWVTAFVGLLSGLVWGATAVGWIKPLVVVSGSMEPEIMTGDLLIARPTPSAQLKIGDVASIYNDVTGNIVTHRIIGIEPMPDGTWQVTMKGDNNDAADGGPYYVGETTWTPRWQFSGAGTVVAALTERSVVVPLVIALLAMFLLTLVPRDEDDDGDSDGQQAVTEDDPGGVAAPVPDDQARVDQLASAAPPAERGGSM